MKKVLQKLPPPSYFACRTTEEIPLKINNKLCGNFLFIFTLAKMARMFIKNKVQ
jgi:hypothetical protein